MTELVVNNGNGSIEKIAMISFSTPLCSLISLAKTLQRITVDTYSKDPDILNKSKAISITFVHGLSSEDNEKILRFCSYLSQRVKAAILSIPIEGRNPLQLYLLPSNKKLSQYECVCLESIDSIIKNNGHLALKEASLSSIPKVPVLSSGSFLGNLLNKSKVTQDARSLPVNPIDQLKQQRINFVQNLTNQIKEQFQGFSDDSSFLEFHLEPMDKDSRYIVREVADEFPDLLCSTVGDEPERHILVYRKGHIPAGLEETEGQDQRPEYAPMAGRKNIQKKASAPTLEQLPESMQLNLIKLNTQKRDRRTAADVMEDIKRRKLS